MAIKSKGTGTGGSVSFTPDSTYAGPYNYTRADIPIFKTPSGTLPGASGGPGTPATPATPGRTGRPGAAASGGRLQGGMSGMQANLNATVRDAMQNGFGQQFRSPVQQTGAGMALGGAGRGNGAPPLGGPLPPFPAPSGGLTNQNPQAPAGSTMPGAQPPLLTMPTPNVSSGGLTSGMPRVGSPGALPGGGMPISNVTAPSAPRALGLAPLGQNTPIGTPQARSAYSNALMGGGAFKGR